jgi:hypothetical protein
MHNCDNCRICRDIKFVYLIKLSLQSPRGSNPKSPGRLPSSHGGGTLPGNHKGLSGSAAAHTVVVDLTLSGADVLLFTLSFLPRKAFEVPNGVPFFWELHAIQHIHIY